MSLHIGCLRAVSVSFGGHHANTCTTASQPEAVAGPLSMSRRRRSAVRAMCLALALPAVPLFARLQRSRKELARLAVVLLMVTAGMGASMGLSGCGIDFNTVTPSGDGHETITPSTPQAIDYGATQTFTVTANTGFTVSNTVGGTCPAGSWYGNTYITGAVTSNCSVIFSSTGNTYTVTPSGNGGETITPSTPQTVDYGATQAFTVTANTGYTLSHTVGGTCPAGSWSGNTYTTGAVTSNCSVIFSSIIDTYTVTASGDAHVTPNPASQTVDYNQTGTITLTVASGYTAAIASNTCGGSLSGNTYTTGAVTSNCSVSFSSTIDTYTVTASGDAHVTPSPTSQTVDYNQTGTITLTVASGYTAAIASNTCGGSLSGNTFTTGAVTGNCSVSFSSAIDTYTVTPSGDGNEAISPSTPQTVDYDATQAFTVTANTGYTLSHTVGGTCPAGSWSGSTYTTGAVTGNCSVSFSSAIDTYTVTASGDAHVTPSPTSQTVGYNQTGTITLTVASGYTAAIASDTCGGSLSGNTYTTGAVTSNCSVSFSSTIVTYTVTASGDAHVTPSPTSQSVDYNQTDTITLTVESGYVPAIASDTCGGSLSGNTYTTGIVTGDCSVSFSGVAVFPVAEGPSNVIAAPGNGQVTVSWTAPTNTGTGAISSYSVTYGPTSGTAFTAAGCSTSSTSCTVSGLTNGTAYTFAVTTTTTVSGAHETGPATFSSSVTPTAGLAVSPSTLALSSLASSHSARIITLTNNSNSPIALSAVPTTYSDFSPSLPSDVTISSTCNTSTPMAANGGSCTITVTPGTTASSDSSSQPCTNGTAPETSAFNVTTSPAVAINAVVLGYGCQYQGGYLFSIDDTAATTSSIGGKVVATADQGSNVQWSPGGALDSIWGIDDTSAPASPSPNASSIEPATLKLGQFNCNGVNDGGCATTNTFVYYGAGTNYAAGLCKRPLNNSGATCSGGSQCYTDWHLPSTCELGPFGSTGVNTGNYPFLPGSQSCSSGSTNIQNELVSTSIVSLSGEYWSATEDSELPQTLAWSQFFASSGSFQTNILKIDVAGVRCVRDLTN